jgi:hypothetical protein
MFLKNAITHFLEFHKGAVNITLHLIGFAGLFYSVYKLDWMLFALFFIILEAGHVFNHFNGIKRYDFRLKTICWRLLIFLAVVVAFYFLCNTL